MVSPNPSHDAGAVWAGVDVGGRRKGFHVALIDTGQVLELKAIEDPRVAAAWIAERAPRLAAVDSPLTPAPAGERSRAGERELAARVCPIRYTPNQTGLAGNPGFYEWIVHGFELATSCPGQGDRHPHNSRTSFRGSGQS